jgi:hypothetical protein
MSAFANVTLPQIGAFCILLGFFAFAVRQAAGAARLHRPSPDAFASVAVMGLVIAVLVFGSWVLA